MKKTTCLFVFKRLLNDIFPNVFQGFLETFSGLGMMVGPPLGGALYEVRCQFTVILAWL